MCFSEFVPTHNPSRRRFLKSAAVVGTALAAAPLLLSATPADAGGLFNFTPSVDDQKKVGEQAAQQVLKQYKPINDSRTRQFVSMGHNLVGALTPEEQRTWDYKFHMLDSKEINAFALPGGNIFMFTGLYDELDSEDSLAAVTGHEMTHVRKQHWAQAYAKQQQRGLILGLGLSFFHAGQAAQTIAGMVDSAIGLGFSRNEEDQADAGGLDDMVHAGYNPQGMVNLFGTLQKVAGNGGGLGGAFMSNHPLTSDRIKHTEQRIAAIQAQYRFNPLRPLSRG